MKVYVNNRGWVMGVERKNGDMVGLKFTMQYVVLDKSTLQSSYRRYA